MSSLYNILWWKISGVSITEIFFKKSLTVSHLETIIREKGGLRMKYTKLRYMRKEKRISATEMAKYIGLGTNSAYLKKETGAVELSLKEARMLAAVFDMTIEELFFDDMDAEHGCEISNNQTYIENTLRKI